MNPKIQLSKIRINHNFNNHRKKNRNQTINQNQRRQQELNSTTLITAIKPSLPTKSKKDNQRRKSKKRNHKIIKLLYPRNKSEKITLQLKPNKTLLNSKSYPKLLHNNTNIYHNLPAIKYSKTKSKSNQTRPLTMRQRYVTCLLSILTKTPQLTILLRKI